MYTILYKLQLNNYTVGSDAKYRFISLRIINEKLHGAAHQNICRKLLVVENKGAVHRNICINTRHSGSQPE